MKHAIFNGQIIDITEANVSITDQGYFFDFVVYSSLKVIQGNIFFLEYHINRFFESAELINLKHRFRKNDIVSWLNKLIEIDKINDALLRMVLIGDSVENSEAKLFMFSVGGLTFYPNKFYKQGIKVITYNGERHVPQSKTKDLLISFLAYSQAKKNGALDALLIDHRGYILEGTRTNFFAIKKQTIISPPPQKVLDGVTKKIILMLVKDHFAVEYKDIPLSDIHDYDEFFISSTSMNVMPIRQIDDVEFDTDFRKTHFIGKLFKEYYDKEILKK